MEAIPRWDVQLSFKMHLVASLHGKLPQPFYWISQRFLHEIIFRGPPRNSFHILSLSESHSGSGGMNYASWN